MGAPQEMSISVKGAVQKRHRSKLGEQKPQWGNFCMHSSLFCTAACRQEPVRMCHLPGSSRNHEIHLSPLIYRHVLLRFKRNAHVGKGEAFGLPADCFASGSARSDACLESLQS